MHISCSDIKMKWKLALFGFAMVIMVFGETETEEIFINQLQTPKAGGFKVCITGTETYTTCLLTVKDSETSEGIATDIETTDFASKCFNFKDVHPSILQDLKVELTLTATNSIQDNPANKNGFGSATVKVLSENVPILTVDEFGPDDGGKKVLRVNADLVAKGQVFSIGTETQTCALATKPCYLMNIDQASNDYSVCKTNIRVDSGSEISLCSDKVTPNIVSKVSGGATAVTLDHHSTNTGISLEAVCNDKAGCNKAEMVIEVDSSVTKICKLEKLSKVTCPLTSIAEGSDYDIFIAYINKDGNTAVSYERKTIKNRNLVASQLIPGVIEATWKFVSKTKYQIVRDPVSIDSFSTADVDCSHLTNEFCYVYFTGLTEDKYSVTLKIINNWTDAFPPAGVEIDPEMETSDDEPNKAHDKTIDIEVENIQVRQEIVDKMAKFCFDSNYEISNKTTQYEIILINDKGNWKKSLMKRKIDKNQEYSTSIMFPLEQLHEDSGLTMIAVARDINSGIVLASGEKKLKVSALRAIKPEVDNGSGGSTSTLAIVGAAIGGIACLMALVAAAVMFVMKIKRNNDGLQYPLHHTNIEQDSSYIHGLDNPIPTF